jgi:hypothetical protein
MLFTVMARRDRASVINAMYQVIARLIPASGPRRAMTMTIGCATMATRLPL